MLTIITDSSLINTYTQSKHRPVGAMKPILIIIIPLSTSDANVFPKSITFLVQTHKEIISAI